MNGDPLEWTVRDPLEETVPDPVERRRRLSPGRRRAVEAVALAVLAPGLLATQWVDNEHQSRSYQTREQVTVVARGGTGTIERVQLRLLGRDTTGAQRTPTTPAGAVSVKLVVQARPLDAKGAKNLDSLGFTLRDRAGHVWTADGGLDLDKEPAAGAQTQLTITGDVPAALAGSVVLEARPGQLTLRAADGWTPVLRFAH